MGEVGTDVPSAALEMVIKGGQALKNSRNAGEWTDYFIALLFMC